MTEAEARRRAAERDSILSDLPRASAEVIRRRLRESCGRWSEAFSKLGALSVEDEGVTPAVRDDLVKGVSDSLENHAREMRSLADGVPGVPRWARRRLRALAEPYILEMTARLSRMVKTFQGGMWESDVKDLAESDLADLLEG